jgi:hypothetical protein
MKNKLYVLMLCAFILSCKAGKPEKIIVPRTITANEDFNSYSDSKENALTIVEQVGKESTSKEPTFSVKYGDTLIRIQPDKADSTFLKDRFSHAEYINTQKTSLLVQLSDSTGQVAPFYLINLKDGKIQAVSLYRASAGAKDVQYTKGMIRVGNSGYLVNNDFFVTLVNAKVYLIPRQVPKERIQGEFFLKSSDKTTFVFLVRGAFYQVNYPTGDVYVQPLPASAPTQIADVYKWVQDNFVWVKNAKGISFFKQTDPDKVIDMRTKY